MSDKGMEYADAVKLLPYGLRDMAYGLDARLRPEAEEFRLRSGRNAAVLFPGGEKTFNYEISQKDLNSVLEIATGASVHSSRESVRNGFVTVRGGHRIGICGSTIVRDGEITGIRELSSVAIRISKEIRGVSDKIIHKITENRVFQSALIISPPGCGKTTLLRDIVRRVSDGDGISPMRISLADERGEVAAVFSGVPQMDVGKSTDIMSACPKAHAVMLMLRSMNPQVIALDEITAPEDITAIKSAANCGVRLLATAHAEDLGDLQKRVLYRELLDLGIFKKAITISREDGVRSYTAENLEVG